MEHLAKVTGDGKVFALTAGLSPSQVLKDVMTTSSSLRMCKNQKHDTREPTIPLSRSYVLYVGCSQPLPPKQAVSTPYRWELVSSQVLLVPSPQCTTCAGRKKIRSKLSQVRSQALLSHTVVLGKHWLTRLPCTHTVKQLQTHSIFCPNMHSINALHIFRASHTEYTLYN